MKNIVSIGLLVFVLALAGLGISKYNTLSKMDERADAGLSLVDTKLQKRYDLLGELASTAKGYANHEQTTLIETAQARAGIARQMPIDPATGKPASREALEKNEDLRKKFAENQALAAQATQQAMMAINQVREAYPELKASPLFAKLQGDISKVEKEISDARAYSNLNVRKYNTALRTFPGNILASITGFEKKPYFEVDAEAKKAPRQLF